MLHLILGFREGRLRRGRAAELDLEDQEEFSQAEREAVRRGRRESGVPRRCETALRGQEIANNLTLSMKHMVGNG